MSTIKQKQAAKANFANYTAVLDAYGFPKDAAESEIVARLFKMYQELIIALYSYFSFMLTKTATFVIVF